ncbi:IclR family transcriptional regulator [Paraburkholderia kururiensis]|uniref:Helix-turn-helix domain-containing protein n=1 Tax=Paraburkholderia kururiensis TaxID=984307 RepID=A0ABZ0WTC8_9BURK|nr:helix-turn-helix domain-containing protein [Paraburkholderia kururiensis]WQD80591.1 helix-turn-helix domain-containing protein [Paraburkholderia kururiensis]
MEQPDTSEPVEKNERRGIQSVEIAFRLLMALQNTQQALPLKEIATRAEMTPSAANNYLVSLVRTGLAAADEKPGYYRLGPAALMLGVSATRQIDGFDVVRGELGKLRDATQCSGAITMWTTDGVLSLFKLEGQQRGAFELRTGLMSLLSTAAGKVFAASLPLAVTRPFLEQELASRKAGGDAIETFHADVMHELQANGYATMRRSDIAGYASIAAPVINWTGDVKFVISLVGADTVLDFEPGSKHVVALLESAARATALLGGRPRSQSDAAN